jgi:hypothetical protein
VQVEFFLANWSEIRSSDAMRNVFQQIRLGRHPGFGAWLTFFLFRSLFVNNTAGHYSFGE